MAQKNNLEVKNFKIDEIHPYENNPRFNKDAVSKVAASIKKFGFKNPILVDKNMVIIAGHTRLEAAKKLKLDEVPCIVAADLNEKQAKALRLADNKVAEFSTWDYLKLDEELKGLEDTIRQNYPNANGDEFWLFPTQRTDVLKTVVGNGGRPVSYAVYGSVSDNTPGAPTTRGIYALDVRSFEVTVIIHSNSLKTARALDNNFLWDWNGSNSRNVFVAWYENLIDGTANLYPLAFKGSIDGPGTSSQLYGSAVVLGLRRNFSEPTAVAVMPPIFRVHDNDSMFSASYNESSLLKVETVYQFAA